MRVFYWLLPGLMLLAWLVALGAAGLVALRLRRLGKSPRWWWVILPWHLSRFCHEEDCYYANGIYPLLRVGKMAGILGLLLLAALGEVTRPLWWPEDYLFERGTAVHPVPLPRHDAR